MWCRAGHVVRGSRRPVPGDNEGGAELFELVECGDPACAGFDGRAVRGPDVQAAEHKHPARDGAGRGFELPASALDGVGSRPFGVYVHVPFCATRCGYCDFNTYTAGELRSAASPE